MHEDSETRVELLVEFQTTQNQSAFKILPISLSTETIRDSVVALSFWRNENGHTAFLVKFNYCTSDTILKYSSILMQAGKQFVFATIATLSSIAYPTTAFSPRAISFSSSVYRRQALSTFAFASQHQPRKNTRTTIYPLWNDIQKSETIRMTTATANTSGVLQKITPLEVTLEIKDPVNPKALEQAKAILSELVVGNTDNGRVNPEKLLEVAKRLGDVDSTCTVDDLIVSKEACKEAYESLNPSEKKALDNMHHRIKSFAQMQRASVKDTEMDIPGGKAGHTVSPCRGTYCVGQKRRQ